MKKIQVLVSNADAYAISDYNVEAWYKDLIEFGSTAIVATSLMFNQLRVGVRLKEVEPFEFEFEGKTYSVGERGQLLPSWPDNFYHHLADQMYVLMKGTKEGLKLSERRLAGK
jgi:hypothetical protein